jgi:hypothetical protein
VPAGYDAFKIIGFSDSDRAEINMNDQKQGKDETKNDMKEISQLEPIKTQKFLQNDFRKK